jgi:hypothetical protein
VIEGRPERAAVEGVFSIMALNSEAFYTVFLPNEGSNFAFAESSLRCILETISSIPSSRFAVSFSFMAIAFSRSSTYFS